MALTDENGGGMGTTMLVSPATMGGGVPYPVPMYSQGGGGGNGMFGDNSWWVVLLVIILFAAGGNWGGNNNGGGMMGAGAPIVINDGNGGSVQRGLRSGGCYGWFEWNPERHFRAVESAVQLLRRYADDRY